MVRLCYLREGLGKITATDSISHSSSYLPLYLFTSPAPWHTSIKYSYDVTPPRHHLHLDDELLS